MHKDLFLMLAAAALVVIAGYFLTGKRAAAGSQTLIGGSPDHMLINDALPGQPGWGWQYFSGGISIGPDGTYYLNGQAVSRPS